jgi:lipoprotein-anchoring transpeptidase ErfK/SrfK
MPDDLILYNFRSREAMGINQMNNVILIRLLFIFFAITFGIIILSPQAKAQSLSPYGIWDYNTVPQQQYEFDMPEWGTPQVRPSVVNPGPKVSVVPEEPEIVEFPNDETAGTIIISQKSRRLYYVIDSESALEYPIGVGREGFQWKGVQKVSRIEEWPEWIPPPEMRQRRPELPVRMAGGVNNPLGAVAIYLGNSLYRIHGSNEPKTIGTESSSGCFRMHNEHAVHLASLVTVGTIVKVY